jgi:hypothetical protein
VPETIQRSFTSGEISPSLQSRADTVKYATGLNLCQNFLIRAQGGAYSRPGLRFVGEVGDSLTTAREIPFSFNTEQTYNLVFQALTMRVVKDGAFVLKPVATITGITQANPAVVTAANTFANGEKVSLSAIVGMTELNGTTPTIANVTGTTFELVGVDSTAFGAYVSGGSAQSDGIFELVTPYTEAQLPFLGFTQSADVMTIVNPNHDPRDLNRLADDNWTLVVINYASTVTAPTFATTDVKVITNITQADPANVTAVGHGRTTGDLVTIAAVVGMVEVNDRAFVITVTGVDNFELFGEDSTGHSAYVSGGTSTFNALNTVGDPAGGGSFDKTYTYVVTAVDASGIESLASSAASITVKSLSQTFGVRLVWDVVAGADHYRIYKDPSNNTAVFGFIGESNNTNFDDFNIAPIISDTPPRDRQPFTGAGNKPSAVNYYQQRQIFANTTAEPQAVFTTQTANFNSLRTSSPARDDDAITFTIVGREVNEIRHIVSLDSMLLLTSGGEWKTTEGQDQVLTPATIGARQQSYNGSSWVPPVVVNSTALYLQEKGAKVRDLGYEFSSDKFTGNDLSLMSEHLFEGFEITSMAYASIPYSIIWCVRDDGVLLGLTYQREHQVWGWHQHITDGLFESVAVVTEGKRDAVYVVVKRTINGATKRYVERMESREQTNAEDAFYVDSGLSYDGVPATVFSGLEHLEGEAVAVLADGYEVEGLTVTSGSITLARAASKVHVGLAYLPAIELLDIDVASASDTLKSRSVSVSKVLIEVEKSRGGFIGPRADGEVTIAPVLQEIKPRFESDGYNAIALRTFKQEVIIEPQWSKGGGVRIEQRSPLPLAILSVIPTVDLGGH